jgi:hypothetical protein
MIAAHQSLAPIPPSRFAPWIPPRVEALILRGLAKKPADRPVSAYAFAEELYELQFVDESATTSSRVGIVRHTTEPSHTTITEWEERERQRDPSGARGVIVHDTHREMTPPPVEGRSLEVDPNATSPATRSQPRAVAASSPPVAGKVPWHVAPTKSEGGTSRSLLSVGQNAGRNRKRNRILAVTALLGVFGLALVQAVVLVGRSSLPPQAATAVARRAAAEARPPEEPRPAPSASSGPSMQSIGAPPISPVAALVPEPSATALASTRPAAASTSVPVQRPTPPRPAPVVPRNTMADQL